MTECVHPDCTDDSIGGSINGAEVCIEHIDWAMGKAFAPVHELQDLLNNAPLPQKCPDCGDRHQATTPCHP